MPINTYEENRILSASPIELVRILYTAATRAVRAARKHLREGDIASQSREITRAQEILLELATSVDSSKAPELSGRLLVLYDYMQARLIAANTQQKDGPLGEVANLLDTLQEAWSQCSTVEGPEMVSAGREPQASARGRFQLLPDQEVPHKKRINARRVEAAHGVSRRTDQRISK